MPPLPRNSPESSKHTYVPSTPRQHHSQTASASLLYPVPDIHVEKSHFRGSAGVGGSMAGEDSRNGRPGRVPQSSSGMAKSGVSGVKRVEEGFYYE